VFLALRVLITVKNAQIRSPIKVSSTLLVTLVKMDGRLQKTTGETLLISLIRRSYREFVKILSQEENLKN